MLTPRLVLRHFTLDDLPVAHSLYADPEVMRFSPFGVSATLEDTRTILAGHLASYAEHGFGKWAVALRATNELVGVCGVALAIVDGAAPVPELGYRLFPKFYGQGYATEAAKVALDHCFSFLGLPLVFGLVEPENLASVRVLLKLGMTYERRTVWHGKATDIYRSENPVDGKSG